MSNAIKITYEYDLYYECVKSQSSIAQSKSQLSDLFYAHR